MSASVAPPNDPRYPRPLIELYGRDRDRWFKALPAGLQAGILAFMDSQAHSMGASQMPTVVPKPANNPKRAPKGSTTARARTA